MKFTGSGPSAWESRKTTTRVPASIILPKVGQSLCFTGSEGGMYVRLEIPVKISSCASALDNDNKWYIPAASKMGFHTVAGDKPSGLVKRSVSTSFGFLSRNVLTSLR